MAVGSRMEVSTPNDLEVVMTRTFAASRELVFQALTQPDLVRRWLLGPPGWTMPICDIDLRVDGTFCYGWRGDENGAEFGFHGSYREIVVPERIVHTELPNGEEVGEGALVTWLLIEQDGATHLSCTMRLPTRDARDAVIATGMADGVAVSFDRLAEILA